MSISTEVRSKYAELLPIYDGLKTLVDQLFKKFLRDYPGYFYLSRIKSLESLFEKIESGRFSTWEKLGDYLGTTIVVPNKNDINIVKSYIQNIFNVIEERSRSLTNIRPTEFPFDSIRLYVKVKDEFYANFKDYIFEIQIKTFLEHAWSVATHPIMYKSEIVEWRLDRLCYSIKASIEQLDVMLNTAIETSLGFEMSQDDDYICKKMIFDFIKPLFDNGRFDDVKKPKDYSRFCDNAYNLFKSTVLYKYDDKIVSIRAILNLLNDKLNEIDFNIPESLSLNQMFFCILIENNVNIKNPKYNYFLSQEMISFYPKLSRLPHRFTL